jgi:RNA polymerase sigma factor for flagellar operon FliA
LPDLQNALVDASTVMVSLDGMGEGDDEEETTLHEMLSDDSQPDPASAFDEQELEVNLLSAIKSLPEREQLVLSLYYYNELTLKEIGEVLHVSESRVCQLHARAVMSLRAGLTQARPQPRDQEYSPPPAHGYPVPQVYDYDLRR